MAFGEAVLNATKCLQVRVQEFCQHSCATATLLQTRDTMSARARTTADSRERGRPRVVPKVLCENHLRGVLMCACSKKDGSALFAKQRHCTMVQSGLTRAREQNHSFTSGGMCVLRHFAQGSAGFSSPAPSPTPSPAATGSSPAGSATGVIAMSSCTATCSATVAIVSCIGCPRRHHAGVEDSLLDHDFL